MKGFNSRYIIWAEGQADGLFAKQAGFLCENKVPCYYNSKKRAELKISDIEKLCMNNTPAATYFCIEWPAKSLPELFMHLEMLRVLDSKPGFDPSNFQTKRLVYGDTGGHCMVATVEVYLPDIDKTVWVNCNDESVEITSADHIWNQDDSEGWDRFEDVKIYSATFQNELPEDVEPWFQIIQNALEYTIERETNYLSTFSLPVVWLPEAFRENVEPEYLKWLQEQGKEITIGKDRNVVIDEAYLGNSQIEAGDMEFC